jgi:hypothetical protein
MALQLNITLPNGAAGNYLRVVNVEWNRLASVCVFQLALYLSEAQADAAPRYPLGIVAQVRVDRDKFEQYLSNQAIAAASHNIIAQLYAITRAEPGCITLLGSLRDIDLTTATDV